MILVRSPENFLTDPRRSRLFAPNQVQDAHSKTKTERNFEPKKKLKNKISQMCPKFVLGCLELPVAPSRGLCGPLRCPARPAVLAAPCLHPPTPSPWRLSHENKNKNEKFRIQKLSKTIFPKCVQICSRMFRVARGAFPRPLRRSGFLQMRPKFVRVFLLLCLQFDLILETKVGFDAGGLEISEASR